MGESRDRDAEYEALYCDILPELDLVPVSYTHLDVYKRQRLRCKQKRKFRATTNPNHNLPVAPNLLNQTFTPTAPNQVWVADLTYVATQEGWLYLAGIKDVYTCEIVGYAMGERMTKELTGKALFMALRSQRPPAGLIHHSDRGSQYCAYDYRVIQEQFGLKTSMSVSYTHLQS